MANIAILGYGTVGSGTAELLYKNRSLIEKQAGEPVEIKYILDVRDFPGDRYADRFVKDFAVIENDAEVGVVVEVIGGVTAAYDFVRRALSAGKSAVTSNKELVASKGEELFAIASEKGVNFFFEASTGGAVPIITSIKNSVLTDEVTEIRGILNGTTNYILSQMKENRVSYETALASAQELGYAERDPCADVSGKDSCRKICILAALVWGVFANPDEVPTIGIDKITLEDIDGAAAKNCEIKLLALAKR